MNVKTNHLASGLLCIIGLVPILLQSCNTHENKPTESFVHVTDTSVQLGKALAVQFCQSCHLFPDPSLLDKKTWRTGVLPGMGPHLGIFKYKDQYYNSSKSDDNVSPNYYPKDPLISIVQWQHILDYYTAMAPDSLTKAVRKEKIISGLPYFSLEIPNPKFSIPSTCYTHIDTTANNRGIVFSDANSQKLFFYTSNLTEKDSLKVMGPVVDIAYEKKILIACNMGFMNPSNTKLGFLQNLYQNSSGKYLPPQKIFPGLARPVQVIYTDLNQDRKKDYLVCEFGNLSGALIWMEEKDKGNYQRHILREAPGAIKAIVTDYNHDGLPDIVALFTQAQEGIVLFTNKGKGIFEEQQLMRFPAVYGSSSFELDDFNKDGYPDILYTCGDNADYSPIIKPYHGVYIFINDGKNNFSQKYFFPVSGCFKAMARDFDGDGDLDIAASSFFTDPQKKEEGFVYLENKGNFSFQSYTFPEAAFGKWLTMDVNDLDGDGKPDIILGNFNFGSAAEKKESNLLKNASFIILKNKTGR